MKYTYKAVVEEMYDGWCVAFYGGSNDDECTLLGIPARGLRTKDDAEALLACCRYSFSFGVRCVYRALNYFTVAEDRRDSDRHDS